MKNYLILIICACVSFLKAQNNQDPLSNIHAQFKKSMTLLDTENEQEAYNLILNGIEEAKRRKSDTLIAKGYVCLSDYYLSKKNNQESIRQIEKGLLIYKNNKLSASIAETLHKRAIIYINKGDYEKALKDLFESLKINELNDNQIKVAELLNRIGYVYLITKEFDPAKKHLNRALEINQKENNPRGALSNLANLGTIHQKLKEFDEAIRYYNDALVEVRKVGLDLNEAILLGNIGSSNSTLGNYETSLEFLFQALTIKERIKNWASASHTCSDISETYIKLEDFDKAKEYALKAIDYSKETNANQYRYAYHLLATCEYELGNYKDSYDDLRTYTKINDSLFNSRKDKSMKELQVKYDTEKRDLKIKAQESDIALLAQKNKNKNQLIIFGLIGLVALFSIALLLRNRTYLKKQKILQEEFSQGLINAQEKERSRLALELHDSVGQQLMMLTRKSKSMGDETITSLATDTLSNLRSISRDLHPATLEKLGFTAAVEELINKVDEEEELFFTHEIEAIDRLIDSKSSLHLYRIIQESLANIVKHSEAKSAEIILKKENDTIDLTISDTGKGFNYKDHMIHSKSLGMRSLKERCDILNATLIIDTAQGYGTRINVLVKL